MDREPPARENLKRIADLVRVADEVAHDLGNLLGVIAGQVALLETVARRDPDARESVEELMTAVNASVARLHDLAAALRKASGAELIGE